MLRALLTLLILAPVIGWAQNSQFEYFNIMPGQFPVNISASNITTSNLTVSGTLSAFGTLVGTQLVLPTVAAGGTPPACTVNNDGAIVRNSLGLLCTCTNGVYVTGKANLITGLLGAVTCGF